MKMESLSWKFINRLMLALWIIGVETMMIIGSMLDMFKLIGHSLYSEIWFEIKGWKIIWLNYLEAKIQSSSPLWIRRLIQESRRSNVHVHSSFKVHHFMMQTQNIKGLRSILIRSSLHKIIQDFIFIQFNSSLQKKIQI